MHSLLDLRAAFAFRHGDIVLALQLKPELGAIAEAAGKTKGHIRRERSRAPTKDFFSSAKKYQSNDGLLISARLAEPSMTVEISLASSRSGKLSPKWNLTCTGEGVEIVQSEIFPRQRSRIKRQVVGQGVQFLIVERVAKDF